MAKSEKSAGKADTKTKDTGSEFKYGVADLADLMEIEPASVRVQLRNHEVTKNNGNSYGWKTKDDLKAVADKLRSGAKAEKAKPKVKAAGTERAKPEAKSKDKGEAKAKVVPKKKAA